MIIWSPRFIISDPNYILECFLKCGILANSDITLNDSKIGGYATQGNQITVTGPVLLVRQLIMLGHSTETSLHLIL